MVALEIGNRRPAQEQALTFGGGEFCDIDDLVIIFSHKRANLVEFTVGKQLFPKYFCGQFSFLLCFHMTINNFMSMLNLILINIHIMDMKRHILICFCISMSVGNERR